MSNSRRIKMSIEIRSESLNAKPNLAAQIARMWCKAHRVIPCERDIQEMSRNIVAAAEGASNWYGGVSKGRIEGQWKFLSMTKSNCEYVRLWGYRPESTRKKNSEMDRQFCNELAEYLTRMQIPVINPYRDKNSQYN
jgi:hypothetical protein